MRAGGGKYGAIISRGSYGYAGSDKADSYKHDKAWRSDSWVSPDM